MSDTTDKPYDVAVVGTGLMGSAIARISQPTGR